MSKIQSAINKAKREGVYEGKAVIKEHKFKKAKEYLNKRDIGPARTEIQVDYSTTKVLSIDQKVFKKNKILSFSHNNNFTDNIKILRTQILNKLREIGANSFLVTSANPYEGKTFTSINLGVSIAQEVDRTVVIVDADLRKPNKYHSDFSNDFFGFDVSKGLADYLLGEAKISDIMLNPSIHKLTIIPAGRSLPNSAELLNSPRMEELVNDLRNRYGNDRIIIFDCPALLQCSDTTVLSNYVEGILLIVEAEKTTRNQLKQVKDLLNGKMILGTLLNKVTGKN